MKKANGLFTADRREVFKEIVERVPTAKVIQQALHRNARAHKNRRTAHHIRRTGNNAGLDGCAHGVIIPQSLRGYLLGLREPLNGLRELFYPLRQEFYGLREELAGLREEVAGVREQPAVLRVELVLLR